MNNAQWSLMLREAVEKPGIIAEAYSAFHNYSIGNQILAYGQCAGRGIPLGPIATYPGWKKLGRQVRKGERAISLCMPVTIPKKDASGEKTGECFSTFIFRPNWFVLSQTDGQDYQNEAPTPAWDKALACNVLAVSEVPFAHSDGNVQGYAQGRSVAVSPIAAYPHKTRFHELAHVVLGHTEEGMLSDDDRTPKDIREVEAESVAYLLCAILELPGLDEARGYIQSWLAGNAISDKSAQRIFGCAEKILKAGKAQA